jgi:hypothetical protein
VNFRKQVDSVNCLVLADTQYVWSVGEKDKRLCVWRLGKERRSSIAGKKHRLLSSSNSGVVVADK